MAGETVIGTNHPLTVMYFSAGLFIESLKKSVFLQQMAGSVSNQQMADAKRERMQSTPDMPIVIIDDLTDAPGDKITVDMRRLVRGKPFMGDRVMEGQGAALTHSTMEVRIDQMRFPIAPGGRMTRKRTRWNLRKAARSEMIDWFARTNDQIIQTCMAGARGDEDTEDWNLPLESDPDFASIMINPLEPPTSNRYFVAGGGDNVGALTDADALKLEDIDVLATTLNDMPLPPSPIKIMSASGDEELRIWCLMVTERQWHYIVTRSTGKLNRDWTKALADATVRASQTRHPLFRGDAGLWRGLLIKKMPRAIRFNTGTMVKVQPSAGGVPTATAVPGGITVDRAILLGGQGMALARGDAAGPRTGAYPMRWSEVMRDHDNTLEVGAAQMDGKRKMRFTGSDGSITDFGIAVLDSYAPDPNSTAGANLRSALSTVTTS